MITEINQSKVLTKDISCECKCGFDGQNVVQINGGITINIDMSVENVMYVNKIIIVKMENI